MSFGRATKSCRPWVYSFSGISSRLCAREGKPGCVREKRGSERALAHAIETLVHFLSLLRPTSRTRARAHRISLFLPPSCVRARAFSQSLAHQVRLVRVQLRVDAHGLRRSSQSCGQGSHDHHPCRRLWSIPVCVSVHASPRDFSLVGRERAHRGEGGGAGARGVGLRKACV